MHLLDSEASSWTRDGTVIAWCSVRSSSAATLQPTRLRLTYGGVRLLCSTSPHPTRPIDSSMRRALHEMEMRWMTVPARMTFRETTEIRRVFWSSFGKLILSPMEVAAQSWSTLARSALYFRFSQESVQLITSLLHRS